MANKCVINAGFTKQELKDTFGTDDTSRIGIEDLQSAERAQLVRKYQAKKQALAIIDNMALLEAHPKGPIAAIEALLTKDRHELSGGTSVEAHIASIRNKAHAHLNEMMSELKPKVHRQVAGIAGGDTRTQGQIRLTRNTVKELFGEKSGDADASSFARVWEMTSNGLRTRMNKAGGDIAKREKWIMPQTHDAVSIGRVDRDEWTQFTKDRIDYERMGFDVDDVELDLILSDMYDALRTDGLSRLTGQGLPTNLGNKVVNRHNSNRFLDFKDADSWLEYQDKFGSQNIYRTMTDYVDTMARDVGLAEKMGPNPSVTMNYMRTAAKKATENPSAGWRAQNTFDILRGKANGEGGKLAQGLASFRNVSVATKLGGALLSAFTDSGFGAMTAYYNGLPALAPMKRYLATIAKGGTAETRQLASKLSLSAEYAVDRGLAAHDYSKAAGSQWSRNLAETVMKVSGLAPHTQVARASFGIEFMSELTRLSAQTFEELGPKMRKAMSRYGIKADDWDVISTSPKMKHKGEEFIDPKQMNADVQAKLIGMIESETEFAVPSPDARVRSATTFGTLSGTSGGELVRTLMQFKAFPLTMLMTQMGRGMAQSSIAGKVSYTGSMLAMTTVLGAVITQSKELTKGKEAMDWDDPHLWINAFRQGGGLGIFGDFVSSNGVTGYASTIAEQVAGPVLGGPVQDIYEMFAYSNFEKLAEGDFSGFTKNAADFVTKNTPGANIWWARLAVERGLMDHLKRASDPDYDRTQRMKMRKMRKETGQKYWWKPGELTPEGM